MKNDINKVSRRDFLISAGTLGTGFSLGLYLPLMGCSEPAEPPSTAAPSSPDGTARNFSAASNATAPEVNAWVVIEPDDTVIIRIARSEMGQGTLTGLAQLVAE